MNNRAGDTCHNCDVSCVVLFLRCFFVRRRRRQRKQREKYRTASGGTSSSIRLVNISCLATVHSCSVDAILKIVLVADWVQQFLRHADWFFVVLVLRLLLSFSFRLRGYIKHSDHISKHHEVLQIYSASRGTSWCLEMWSNPIFRV